MLSKEEKHKLIEAAVTRLWELHKGIQESNAASVTMLHNSLLSLVEGQEREDFNPIAFMTEWQGKQQSIALKQVEIQKAISDTITNTLQTLMGL